MDVRKRAVFLEDVIWKTDLSIERLNAHFGELHRFKPNWLSRRLIGCSMPVFRNYIKILLFSRATAFSHDTLSPVAENEHTATTVEMETHAVPLQASDDPSAKPGTYELGISCKKRESDTLAFPTPSADAHNPANPELTQLVHSLPPELFGKVLQEFLHAVFRPRRIYVGAEPLNLQVLGGLNRAMYAKHRSTFLSESIWVFGQGGYQETIGLLHMMPASLLTSIKKIEVRFTRHDYKEPSPEHFYSLFRKTAPANDDPLNSLMDYIRKSANAKSHLMQIWLRKLDHLLSLKLDELVLDFKDAYGPDGEFVGRRFTGIANSNPRHTSATVTVLGMKDR